MQQSDLRRLKAVCPLRSATIYTLAGTQVTAATKWGTVFLVLSGSAYFALPRLSLGLIPQVHEGGDSLHPRC